MKDIPDLLEQLIECFARDVSELCNNMAHHQKKTQEVRDKCLCITSNESPIFLKDYKESKGLAHNALTTDSHNFKINNKTHLPLHIIICDELIRMKKTQPSMCDYLIGKVSSGDLLLMCELKKINNQYYDDELAKAKSQIQRTFELLHNNCDIKDVICVYGVIGLILTLENTIMCRSFKRFTKPNKKYANRCITLDCENCETKIRTFVTNSITIENKEPFVQIQ